jgi:hypothetical protein
MKKRRKPHRRKTKLDLAADLTADLAADLAADLITELRPMIREAAKTGLVEAIEHCSNFWNVSDGYKKYIDHQIAAESQAIMVAVRAAFRQELAGWARPRRKR